ncbi:hypothetical protein B0H11DRAFT_1919255 [Mycena galericulata]|nr:hypothetical protein B0H11DRAFT_1919255 [Mycena galericulata]
MSLASQIPTATPSSSAAALPKGCSPADFHGPAFAEIGPFTGCTVGVASVLLNCCAAAGGTPAFVNNTCGCPFDTNFTLAQDDTFINCAEKFNATSGRQSFNWVSLNWRLQSKFQGTGFSSGDWESRKRFGTPTTPQVIPFHVRTSQTGRVCRGYGS